MTRFSDRRIRFVLGKGNNASGLLRTEYSNDDDSITRETNGQKDLERVYLLESKNIPNIHLEFDLN